MKQNCADIKQFHRDTGIQASQKPYPLISTRPDLYQPNAQQPVPQVIPSHLSPLNPYSPAAGGTYQNAPTQPAVLYPARPATGGYLPQQPLQPVGTYLYQQPQAAGPYPGYQPYVTPAPNAYAQQYPSHIDAYHPQQAYYPAPNPHQPQYYPQQPYYPSNPLQPQQYFPNNPRQLSPSNPGIAPGPPGINGAYHAFMVPTETVAPSDSSKNPNIYLRCKDYTDEKTCFADVEDNCFWNIDLEVPGCRYYVPSEGGAEGEPGAMSDCTLILTYFKCKAATPNGGLCLWNDVDRLCEEAEECEDIADEIQCNDAYYEAAKIQCKWNSGTCDESTGPVLQRARPSLLKPSDSADPIAAITTISLAIPIFIFAMFVSFSFSMWYQRKRTAHDLDDHFVQL